MSKSFGDIIQQYKLLIAGIKKNSKELSLPIKLSDFEKLVAEVEAENQLQEEYKAKAQQSTEKIEEILEKTEGQSAQFKSTIHGKYGKKSEKLEEFGMKPHKKKTASKKTASKNKEKTADSDEE